MLMKQGYVTHAWPISGKEMESPLDCADQKIARNLAVRQNSMKQSAPTKSIVPKGKCNRAKQVWIEQLQN